jgi:hypothetical protein
MDFMQKQISYRQTRQRYVGLTTITLIATCQPFLMLFSHMLATVFWDFWFYTIRGVKESSSLPIGFFEERQINKHQVDRYTQFVVKAKRIFLAIAMIGAGIGIALQEDNFMLAGLGLFYIGLSITIGLALILGYIQQPYPIRLGSVPYSHVDSNTTSISYNSPVKWDDPHNASHPLSYNNPISINYIGS